jgi:exodeoxyribonuclease VII large subunit
MMAFKPDQKHFPSVQDSRPRIYSVTELTAEIKTTLEGRFPFVWIVGEISNFRKPVSGHFYFTLKDDDSQINAVMFRGQNRSLSFDPEDGLQVVGLGRINVYEPRGNYQILLEYLEPKGIGALQIAFEQLKARLAAEGLFDAAHKATIPYIPNKISLITSPTGAVVHDMLNIILRRFPNVHIDILPVKVQGDAAITDIVSAIQLVNRYSDTDVAILARGGGSLEDLHAFNSEAVARAIYGSDVPVISAIGHETDYTIADFTADLRAPTPSAAAELVVPVKKELILRCNEFRSSLDRNISNYFKKLLKRIDDISKHLVHPKKKIEDLKLRIDDLTDRMTRRLTQNIRRKCDELKWRLELLYGNNPIGYIDIYKIKLEKINHNLLIYIKNIFNNKSFLLKESTSKLSVLSPEAILERGYSITRTVPEGAIVRSSEVVSIDQKLDVILAKGCIRVRIDEKSDAPDQGVSIHNHLNSSK